MVSIAFFIFAGVLMGSAIAVVFSRNSVHSVLYLILAFFNAAGLFVLIGAEFLAMLLVVVYVGAVAVLFLFVVMMMDINPETQPRLFAMNQFKKTSMNVMVFVGYSVVFLGLFIAFGVLLTKGYNAFMDLFDGKELMNDDLPWISQLPWIAPLYDSTMESRFILGCVAYLLSWGVATRVIGVGFLQAAASFINSLPSLMGIALLLVVEFCFLVMNWESSTLTDSLVSSPLPPADLMHNTAAIGQVLYRDYVYLFQGAGLILLIAMIGAIVLTLRHRKNVKRQNISDQLKRDPKETLELKKIPLGKGI